MANGLRLGIMQPYFFPYLGHFALIAAVDEWVVFDVTQYTPRTWMNRNRILHPRSGWQYLTVPLSNSSIHIRTSEARLLDPRAAKINVLGKIDHYRKRAPFFKPVCELISQAFDATSGDSLVQLDTNCLSKVCQYLGISFRYRICSDLMLDLPPNLGPGEWALEISTRLGANTYINPAGGRDLFSPTAFAERHITIKVAHFNGMKYATPGYQGESNLSIIDVLMWNAPGAVKSALLEGLRLETLTGEA